MIVVDANIVVHLVRQNSFTALARKVYATDPTWIVPPLWQAEVLNALLNEVRAGNVSLEGALEAGENAAKALRDRVRACECVAVLTTAAASRLTAYDATYVVLARSRGVLLITEDRQILRACPDVARSMRQFLARPGTSLSVCEELAAYTTSPGPRRAKARSPASRGGRRRAKT